MSLDDAIKKYIRKEYQYFVIDITLKVYSYIPNDLRQDPNNIDVFVNSEEATLRHIVAYSNFCLKEKSFRKNPKKAAKDFAEVLIKMDKQKQLENTSLS